MAEGDLIAETSVEDVQDLTKALADLDRRISATKSTMADLARQQKQNTSEYASAEAALKGLLEQQKKLSEQNGYLATQFAKAKNKIKAFRADTKELDGAVGGVSAGIASFGDKLLGTAAAAAALGNDVIRSLITPLSSTKNIVDALPAPLKKYNDVMRSHREILDLVNTSYAGFGRSMAESRTTGRDLVQEIGTISAKFGFSRDAVMKFVESGKALPTIMDAIGKGAQTAGVGATQLENMLLALRGAGMDVSKAGQLMTDLYAKFGTRTAPEAAQQILKFAQAAKTTGINIEFVQKHLVAAAEPLAIFGQKAGVAARTWTTFTDALKNTLPIEQIGKLVNTVTGNIAKMQFQTRAFVAQMSGMAQGVSALGGALRMELDLRSAGGLERNLQKVTRMIARFGGGRITTLEEAVRNPGQEMQFQLQRQLVGQTLGVQGGQEQARVLEVLQRVQRGGLSNLDAQKQMSKLTQSGRDIQKASLTALERLVTLGTQSNRLLETISGIERKSMSDFDAVSRVITRGARTRQPLTREEGRLAGQHLRRAGERVMEAAPSAMENFFRATREGAVGLVQGVTRRIPERRPLERVRPEAPAERMLAERRRERVLPDIEAIVNQTRMREGRGRMPEEPMPFMAPARRAEPPAAFPAPLVPAAPGTQPVGITAGAAEGGPQAAVERQPMNVTLSVTCEKCQEELLRKNLDELSDRRDQNLLGIETGRYRT